MTWFGELAAILIVVFGVPGFAFSGPFVVICLGYLTGSFLRVILIALLILIPLAIFPVPFDKKALSSWIAYQLLSYFSFKVIFEVELPDNKPRILVAPPHGVFPFGNILTMLAFPSIVGYPMRALAASAALQFPVFRQLMGTIGAIPADRSSAAACLKEDNTLGISTGGVAEVFETNSPSGDEVILLKERRGLIKLAFRTGAELVPCYLFGNTHLYSLWTGGRWAHPVVKMISRKIGVALIVFWGRWGLPIPYRTPILGVMGKPIPVAKKEHPSEEEVTAIHEQLVREMVHLFDSHKHIYGWGHKKLVVE
eukprot:gene32140-41672_t